MGASDELIAGRYQVLEVLGQGAFAQTLLAQDLQETGRKVALKIQLFFQSGQPASAEILERHKADNEICYTVTYEFEADGHRHRGVDKVPPNLSRLWHAGDTVQVLYLPERDYDSIVISTR